MKPHVKENLRAKHPIAAIEKRIIDSEAFASLPHSAVVVLLLLARNLTKGGNGRIFLSPDQAVRAGVARKTLYRALKVLMAHGLIYQTKRNGDGRCGLYALTWLPLSKDTKGLHVENFGPRWRDWKPDAKKARGKNVPLSGHFYPSTHDRVDKITPLQGTNLPPLNYIPIPMRMRAWIPDELKRLAACGLVGRQCFKLLELPIERTLQ